MHIKLAELCILLGNAHGELVHNIDKKSCLVLLPIGDLLAAVGLLFFFMVLSSLSAENYSSTASSRPHGRMYSMISVKTREMVPVTQLRRGMPGLPPLECHILRTLAGGYRGTRFKPGYTR